MDTTDNPWLTGWRAVEADVPYAEFGGEMTWTVECDEGSLLTADCPKHEREAVAKLAAMAPRLLAAAEAVIAEANGMAMTMRRRRIFDELAMAGALAKRRA